MALSPLQMGKEAQVSTPSVMQAVVFHDRGDVRIEERPVPKPRSGEVLVQITSAGVCGSDVGEFDHGPVLIPRRVPHPVIGLVGPLVMGHEWAGRIVSVGEGVSDLHPDQLVASGSGVSCGDCAWCHRGQTNLCANYWTLGFQRDGGLAEFCRAPVEVCVPVDEGRVTEDAAGLAQPLSIATHSVRRGNPLPGSDVAIIGAGGIGSFMVAVLRALTDVSDLLVVEPDAGRRDIANAMGATHTVTPSELDHAGGYSTVYEASGSKAGLATALDLVIKGGTIVLVGLQQPGLEGDLLRQVAFRELSLVGPNAHVLRTDFPDALRVLASRDDWSPVAPHMHPLQDAPAVFDAYAKKRATTIKALFDPRTNRVRDARYRP